MENRTSGPKPAFYVAIALVVIGLVWYGGRNYITKLIPERPEIPSVVPQTVTLPDVKEQSSSRSTLPIVPAKVTLPSPEGGTSRSPGCIRYLVWAWNAQMGLMYANGGPTTTPGSLMAKHGVCIKITRQDDVSQMQNEMLKFASQLADGVAQPTEGIHFINIMGDGTAAIIPPRSWTA